MTISNDFKPYGSKVLLTKNRYNSSKIIDPKKIELFKSYDEGSNGVKPYQTILAQGPFCKTFNVGDSVLIDIEKFCPRNFELNSVKDDIETYKRNLLEKIFPTYTMIDGDGNKQDVLLINESDLLGAGTFND